MEAGRKKRKTWLFERNMEKEERKIREMGFRTQAGGRKNFHQQKKMVRKKKVKKVLQPYSYKY